MIRFPFLSRCGAGTIVLVCMTGCATGPVTATGGDEQAVEPFASEDGEASYHLLLAELARERGQFADAAIQYRKAADLSPDPEVAEQAVNLALELGRHDDALAAARRWVEVDPDNVDASQKLSSLLLRDDDVSGAVAELERLLALFGGDPEQSFMPLTGILLNDPEPARAVKAMNRLLGRHDEVGAAHYGMGLLALQSGQYELALDAASRAEALRPEWHQAGMLAARVLVAKGEIDAGLERASDIARTSTDPGLRLDYALLLASLDREGQARLELDLLLEDNPRMPGALRAAGLLEMRRGDLDAAQLHFTSLLATGRNLWEAFFYLGSIAEERQQFARAVRYYSQVRDEDLAVAAQVRAAMLYEKLGEPERAIEHLAQFAREAPRLDADLSIASGEMLARRGEQERALALYDSVLERHPGHRGARFARAFLLDTMDRVDEAIEELRRLLHETPNDPIALNALGYTLADRTARYREAHRLIRKAFELDPENPAIIDSMGWVLFRRGNPDAALGHLQRAYELLPDPEVAAHLAEVLWTLGRNEEAQAILRDALEDNPEDEKLTDTAQRLGM